MSEKPQAREPIALVMPDGTRHLVDLARLLESYNQVRCQGPDDYGWQYSPYEASILGDLLPLLKPHYNAGILIAKPASKHANDAPQQSQKQHNFLQVDGRSFGDHGEETMQQIRQRLQDASEMKLVQWSVNATAPGAGSSGLDMALVRCIEEEVALFQQERLAQTTKVVQGAKTGMRL